MQCCNTDVLIHVCVCGGGSVLFFTNDTVLYQPSVHPCPPSVFASLLTFHRIPCILVRDAPRTPPPNEMTAGCTWDWWPCSRAEFTAPSEPLKLTGSQKTTLPTLRPPKLTLLWPISRNSIPSQSPDLRSPKRDNSSPWKKELDEAAQIVRVRNWGRNIFTSSARFCLFLCLTSL